MCVLESWGLIYTNRRHLWHWHPTNHLWCSSPPPSITPNSMVLLCLNFLLLSSSFMITSLQSSKLNPSSSTLSCSSPVLTSFTTSVHVAYLKRMETTNDFFSCMMMMPRGAWKHWVTTFKVNDTSNLILIVYFPSYWQIHCLKQFLF